MIGGGDIELSVIYKMYKTQIGVMDLTQNLQHVYGVNEGYPQRVWLLYDGIHYDAFALSPFGASGEFYVEDESKDVTGAYQVSKSIVAMLNSAILQFSIPMMSGLRNQ